MKLSIISKTRSELKRFASVPSTRVLNWFPECVPEEFFPVWERFCTSAVFKDVLKAYGLGVVGQYYAVVLFLSMLSKHTKVPDLRAISMYTPGNGYLEAKSSLRTLCPKLHLKVSSHSMSFETEHADWLRCFHNIRCYGTVTLFVQGRKPLDAYLPAIVPSIFKAIPKTLRKDTVPESGNKDFVRPKPLLNAPSQLKATYGWETIPCKRAELLVARAKFNTVLLRYSYQIPGWFPYGSENPDALLKSIRIEHEKRAKYDLL